MNEIYTAAVPTLDIVVQEANENWRLAQLGFPCTEFKYEALTKFCHKANCFRHNSLDVRWVALARQSFGTGEQSELPLHDDFGLEGTPPPTITVVLYLTPPSFGGELDLFAAQDSISPTKRIDIRASDQKVLLRIPHGVWHRPVPHFGLRQALVYTEVTEPYWSIGVYD